MSYKTPIDKIAELLSDDSCVSVPVSECDSMDDCAYCKAKRLYAQGYRKQVKANHRECYYCRDKYEMVQNTVCYIPTDNGSSIDIPVNFCPCCGARLEGE